MSNEGRTAGNRRLVVVLSIAAALLAPLALLAGTGFAKNSPSASQYQYGKVAICHRTHSKKHPFHTLHVNMHALKAHLRHGDTMGVCSQTAAATTQKADKGKHKGADDSDDSDSNGSGHGNGHANGNASGQKHQHP